MHGVITFLDLFNLYIANFCLNYVMSLPIYNTVVQVMGAVRSGKSLLVLATSYTEKVTFPQHTYSCFLHTCVYVGLRNN